MPRESKAARRARAGEIDDRLARQYPDARCSLDYQDPWQLLVATILAAQCTDARVNQVTPELFKAYPGPEEMAAAEPAEVEEIIRSTGFFRNKTKSLLGAARKIQEDFDGEVPRSMDELLSLPGVARKTANVVLGTAFGVNAGVVVDTHVKRLSGRLKLTRQTDPNKIEKDLMELLEPGRWILFAHRLVFHGRACCTARKPQCEYCPIADLCPSAGKF